MGEVRKHIDSEESRKEEYRLNKLREKLDQLIESDPRLRALRPHLLINMMEEGLRIQIIDSQNRPMFKMGSAQVEPYMRDILRAIAPILNDIPNKISLSGHTDDLPYANGERGYSNWELSADRANASRRELLIGGLDEGKVLRVVGMASTMRLKEQASDDPVNRRISILVLNKQTQHDIEHENLDNRALDIEKAESLKQIEATGTAPAATSAVTAATPSAPAAISTGQSVATGSAVSTTGPQPAKAAPDVPVKVPASPVSISPTTASPITAPQTQQSSTGNITPAATGPTTSLPAAPESHAPVSPTSRDAQ